MVTEGSDHPVSESCDSDCGDDLFRSNNSCQLTAFGLTFCVSSKGWI